MPKKTTPTSTSAGRATRSRGLARPSNRPIQTPSSSTTAFSASTDSNTTIRRSQRLETKATSTLDGPDSNFSPSRSSSHAEPPNDTHPQFPPEGHQKQRKQWRKPALKDAAVPAPTVDRLPPVMGHKHERRSEEAQALRSAEKSAHNTQRWLNTCPVFVARNVTRASLEARTKNSTADKKKAEETMKRMKDWEADAFSLVMLSEEGEVLFAYFGYASPPLPQNAQPQWPTFGQFLNGEVGVDLLPEYPGSCGRTDKDVRRGTQHDGLQEANLHRTHVAMQNLCHYLPPVASDRDKRHPEDDMMAYPQTSTMENGTESLEHQGVQREGIRHCKQVYERAGVHHLVHGWPMLGHTNGYLFPSRDMSRTSLGYLSVNGYYLATQATAREISDRFQASFPQEHAEYTEAFEAGVVNLFDEGPFIGRALVWKMQVQVHQDGLDKGPAAIFPCGYYSGGYLYIPDLELKLAYRPRDLAILLAGHLYHAVDEWRPTAVPEGTGVSPGRVSSVFFFPASSFKRLAGKPKFWNLKTMTGAQYSGNTLGLK